MLIAVIKGIIASGEAMLNDPTFGPFIVAMLVIALVLGIFMIPRRR